MPQTATELHHLPSESSIPTSQQVSLRAPPSQGETSAQDNLNNPEAPALESTENVSRARAAVVISNVTCITMLSSMLTGVLTVAIPTIAKDVNLSHGLLLWPSSIYALVCGCTLLLSGSISDAIGAKWVYLAGCFLSAIFTLASGLSRTGAQLIVFRAFSGLALSLSLPSSTSIITHTLPTGRTRNVAFATMGGGQPVGFSIGLVLGGVFSDTVGWRWGFYITAIMNIVVFGVAIKGLPNSHPSKSSTKAVWTIIKKDIDWIGAVLASTSLAMLSYCFASITSGVANIKEPSTFCTLIIAVILVPSFVYWMHRQVKLDRPALIPNSFWRSHEFSTICTCVLFSWASMNGLEQLFTFYLQYVQHVSAIGSSLRYLPGAISGFLVNVIIGLLVHRIRADWIVILCTLLSLGPPLLMALANPNAVFWAYEFPAMVLQPFGIDSLFTISNLLITSVFPTKDQGLAGGVFNTVSQIGKSLGVAITAVIANTVTAKKAGGNFTDPDTLLPGYRSAFWFCFALNAFTLGLSILGLRKIGKVGLKRD